jgi:hypothetical protein
MISNNKFYRALPIAGRNAMMLLHSKCRIAMAQQEGSEIAKLQEKTVCTLGRIRKPRQRSLSSTSAPSPRPAPPAAITDEKTRYNRCHHITWIKHFEVFKEVLREFQSYRAPLSVNRFYRRCSKLEAGRIFRDRVEHEDLAKVVLRESGTHFCDKRIPLLGHVKRIQSALNYERGFRWVRDACFLCNLA